MKSVNTHCPWSGDPVQPDSSTTYKGYTVAFCNPGCRDKFDKAQDAFDAAIKLRGDQSAFKTSLRRLAKYNSHFNRQLFETVGTLPDALYRKDLGAFFASIHGTLNHILVWDLTWLQRFSKHRNDFESLAPVLSLDTPTSHDQIICDDFTALQERRTQIDSVLEVFVEETSDADYASVFQYVISTGEAFQRNFGGMLQHLFNHQTHHRGQITTLLSQNGYDPGVTDLLAILPEQSLEETICPV